MAPLTICTTSDLQRGFVPGRQILQNVLQPGTQSRVYALRCQSERKTRNLSALVPPDQVGKLAILALFDFVCAFPKTSHNWMLMAIERIGMPLYLRNIAHSMYIDCSACVEHQGSLVFLFCVVSGVLTGCSLSSVLFNFCIDPLLWLFSTLAVEPKIGHVLACADDLAACLRRLKHLKNLADIFKLFARIACLDLHPKKCSDVNKDLVKFWLQTHIPEWAHFEIACSGEYLGFQLGPSSGPSQWSSAIAKYKLRVQSINASGDSARLAISNYNKKAVPVLGYLAQLLPPSGI